MQFPAPLALQLFGVTLAACAAGSAGTLAVEFELDLPIGRIRAFEDGHGNLPSLPESPHKIPHTGAQREVILRISGRDARAPSYHNPLNPHSHSIVRSDRNALNSKCKFFLRAAKNRPTDPSEIFALDFKWEFLGFGICSVSATIDIDRSIFPLTAADRSIPTTPKKTVTRLSTTRAHLRGNQGLDNGPTSDGEATPAQSG